MKNVSKLALFVAAGMMTAGAQAAEFKVDDETSLYLFGEMEIHAARTTEGDGDDIDDVSDEGSLIGFGGERNFSSGIKAFVEMEVEYDLFGNDGETEVGQSDELDGKAFEHGMSIFGIEGDFGTIEIGNPSDPIFDDYVYETVDYFESAELSKEEYGEEEDTFAYFSPDFDGFEYQLMLRVIDETDKDQDDTETSASVTAQYDFGGFQLVGGYTENGDNETQDPTIGLGAVIELSDNMEIGTRYAKEETAAGAATDFFAVAAEYDYGAGDIYGGIQSVDADGSDTRTEYALGADYEFEDDFSVYAEYANYDRDSGNDTDTFMEVGLRFEF